LGEWPESAYQSATGNMPKIQADGATRATGVSRFSEPPPPKQPVKRWIYGQQHGGNFIRVSAGCQHVEHWVRQPTIDNLQSTTCNRQPAIDNMPVSSTRATGYDLVEDLALSALPVGQFGSPQGPT
jgi:hypothetical protein